MIPDHTATNMARHIDHMAQRKVAISKTGMVVLLRINDDEATFILK